MKKLFVLLIFIIINFSALGLGTLLMQNGPETAWYLSLDKAPWTPPGWVFGAAWTTIMVCFSFYMMHLYFKLASFKIALLFSIQFLLNVSWNYLFFNQHLITLGLINLILLTLTIFYFFVRYFNDLKANTLFITPYAGWLCVAISLNLYILIHN